MTLIIDISPILINRTAMGAIAGSMADIFADQPLIHQYFGHRFKQSVSGASGDKLRHHLHTAIAQAAQRPVIWNDIAVNTSPFGLGGSSPQVFLDPLYVLFTDLKPNDWVLVLDLSSVTNPEWHSLPVCRLYMAAFEKIMRVKPRLAAISHNTAVALYANYGVPPSKVDVVPCCLPSHFRASLEAGVAPIYPIKPYFLFVGSLEARKNITGAIRSFHRSGLYGQGYELLIVGGHGHGHDQALRLAAETPGVRLAGFVSDEDLLSLYQSATGFLYPSYLEGFGIPLLEAMAFGLPCVATSTGASPEVGGDLVTYCDPDDHEGFAVEMRRITAMSREERDDLAARLRDWAGQPRFSFEGFSTTMRQSVLKGLPSSTTVSALRD